MDQIAQVAAWFRDGMALVQEDDHQSRPYIQLGLMNKPLEACGLGTLFLGANPNYALPNLRTYYPAAHVARWRNDTPILHRTVKDPIQGYDRAQVDYMILILYELYQWPRSTILAWLESLTDADLI